MLIKTLSLRYCLKIRTFCMFLSLQYTKIKGKISCSLYLCRLNYQWLFLVNYFVRDGVIKILRGGEGMQILPAIV